MILCFGVWLGWLPVAGYVPLEGGLWLNLRSLIMPALALGLVQSALIARITRSSMLDVLREQYILAGRSKGLSERVVIYKHALKNAIIPTLTVIGITFALLVGGAVVIETVFNIPGLGRLIISAVLRRDYPVVQGVVLLIALTYTAINLTRGPGLPGHRPAHPVPLAVRELRVFLRRRSRGDRRRPGGAQRAGGAGRTPHRAGGSPDARRQVAPGARPAASTGSAPTTWAATRGAA